MSPLTILHGMALATIVAPMPATSDVQRVTVASITAYELPPPSLELMVTSQVGQAADSSLPKLLPVVPMDDARQLPKITFRDGGVMEIGGGGLKFGWQF